MEEWFVDEIVSIFSAAESYVAVFRRGIRSSASDIINQE